MTRAELEAAIYTWVQVATSGTVIFAQQGVPRPDPPYLTVRLVGPLTTQGFDEAGDLVDPGAPTWATQNYRGDREVTVSVQAFGTGALDLARAAARALNNETTRGQLAAAGLCHRGVTPAVNDLTELLETAHEERAQFDAVLGFSQDYTDTVPLIEKVQGEGTLTNPPNSDVVVPFEADKNA